MKEVVREAQVVAHRVLAEFAAAAPEVQGRYIEPVLGTATTNKHDKWPANLRCLVPLCQTIFGTVRGGAVRQTGENIPTSLGRAASTPKKSPVDNKAERCHDVRSRGSPVKRTDPPPSSKQQQQHQQERTTKKAHQYTVSSTHPFLVKTLENRLVSGAVELPSRPCSTRTSRRVPPVPCPPFPLLLSAIQDGSSSWMGSGAAGCPMPRLLSCARSARTAISLSCSMSAPAAAAASSSAFRAAREEVQHRTSHRVGVKFRALHEEEFCLVMEAVRSVGYESSQQVR